jgi:hypothetical protein
MSSTVANRELVGRSQLPSFMRQPQSVGEALLGEVLVGRPRPRVVRSAQFDGRRRSQPSTDGFATAREQDVASPRDGRRRSEASRLSRFATSETDLVYRAETCWLLLCEEELLRTPLTRGADDASVLLPSAPSTAMRCVWPRLESRGGQIAHRVHLLLLLTSVLLLVTAMPSSDVRRERRGCRILAWEMSDSVGHPMTVEVRMRVRRAPHPGQG